MTGDEFLLSWFETQSLPSFLRCYLRSFAFYLGNPFPRLKLTRLPLSLAATARSFTFHLGNPFPRLKLTRLPLSLAATLAALPSISEIPFLDS